jgi:hypothetical protein
MIGNAKQHRAQVNDSTDDGKNISIANHQILPKPKLLKRLTNF